MRGKVYLVGAGPGDPDLLTVKAQRVIDAADVVLYDSLTGNGIVDGLPPSVTALNVGKKPEPGGKRTSQEAINRQMVSHARAGRLVVRLKSGDPFVFGRGGEEVEYLATEEIPFEIVPGVSSVVAAPGVVGIPVTHRRVSSSITVITGHEDPEKEESALDWSAIGNTLEAGGTLLILMGVRNLPANVAQLRSHGVSTSTPVAMIEKATWSNETTVTGTLGTIVEYARRAEISPPAMTVIGDVVSVREQVYEYLDRAMPTFDSADELESSALGIPDRLQRQQAAEQR